MHSAVIALQPEVWRELTALHPVNFRTVIAHHPAIKRIITHHCVICGTKRALHAAVHRTVIALLPVV
jgi:hypothetical protein